jgi:CO/xanthine dehydrogenase FAD-binding subunit
MKPARFEYDDPRTMQEALALLAEHGEDAKVLAGGQSLVPLLNFRLARPDRLVDLNGVEELFYLDGDDGALRIGAMTRQSTLEHSPLVAERVPLLVQAVRWVGHAQIRNRGTVGGSVAHADPAAELPVALTALEARFHVRSTRGRRTLGAAELFVTHLTTALEPDELLTEIEVPVPEGRTGSAFVEFSRRHGDFALGGAAVLVRLGTDGACERAAVALLAAAPRPVRAAEAEEWLVGRPLDADTAVEAASRAVADVTPTGDIHGGSEYRRELLRAMVRRAVLEAGERAGGVGA